MSSPFRTALLRSSPLARKPSVLSRSEDSQGDDVSS
eukprot:CAMPEP_0198323202 /NCGR_PEP_ID=MMETSP1450-20131203/11508_1 /TAXON_ID=753684 ORGANISM="Madagascaria erythrocladiodes, Strain CCMP3234" /NCGR_SAMPLE_ID=MMETSP1450 /ASSEMBLY_ACC=CAM_ASM_001115 /LENGTH=35 /DNA_ID= /DNA_START= /DNA_END= /DNA_ORIENTATION=